MADEEPLFDTIDERTYMPSIYTRGPWDPTLLHGGPVAALFGELLQDESDDDFQPARLTVDLIRPVPIAPLELATTSVREGRRLDVREGVLSASGKAVARATLTSIRRAEMDATGLNPDVQPPPDEPGRIDESFAPPINRESFVGGAMDFLFAERVGLGHGIGWFRLRRSVLADRPISPLARAAAAADVGNAVSSRRGDELPRVSFVNADLSLSLSRMPEGEWIRLESYGRWEASGVGWVRSQMSDQLGELGAVSNALVLEPMKGSFGWEEG